MYNRSIFILPTSLVTSHYSSSIRKIFFSANLNINLVVSCHRQDDNEMIRRSSIDGYRGSRTGNTTGLIRT